MKEWFLDKNEKYKDKILLKYKRSLSRLCNTSFIAFILIETLVLAPVFIASKSMSLFSFVIVLAIFMVIRWIYIYLIISDTMRKKIVNVSMLIIEILIIGVGFHFMPAIMFIITTLLILIGFPFLFDFITFKR